ncbi:PREDICTED: TCR gamma alternate reading frame protein isoform X3 [Mandrillus leucophaeus]|uniref:TCR gamma alternate reading frame protein isoform X3 n=1 Tax=Mandrillus leucophaeus TaxID=9568 RepID=UPI0005F43592|nr:PREDICTED: TCR gamma alternate reading frame protein isoform X3 [Mandrillus leucophaeus]
MLSLLHASTLAVLGALCVYGAGHLEQPQISSTKMLSKTARLECVVSGVTISQTSIYWYRERPGEVIQFLVCILYDGTVKKESSIPSGKFEVDRIPKTSTSTLTIHNVEKQDIATYYCALWETNTKKLFGPGTKLIITDKHLDADVSPKPTIFLPSIAETNLHKAGTYLCLLENFFPDVIKIHWQEKKSNTILGSQEGNTVKTNDTYMKFSWLTVPEKSLDKEHRCIVRHENNKNGVDQEIIFPPIKTDVTTMDPKDNCSKDANDALLLQLTNTSAYYMYLLLLVKSEVYFAIIAVCLLRRTAVCCNGERS